MEKILEILEKAESNGCESARFYAEKIRRGTIDKSPEYILHKVCFSHCFAKSFWGEDWKNRLDDLVLETRPLEYLSQFI